MRLPLLLIALLTLACMAPSAKVLAPAPPTMPTIPTAPAPPPPIPATDVIAAYKANEIAADARMKGRRLTVTGIAGPTKRDLLGSVYVTIGTGKPFEFPTVQAFLTSESDAATLLPGQSVTVTGTCDGLSVNVLLRNASIVRP